MYLEKGSVVLYICEGIVIKGNFSSKSHKLQKSTITPESGKDLIHTDTIIKPLLLRRTKYH